MKAPPPASEPIEPPASGPSHAWLGAGGLLCLALALLMVLLAWHQATQDRRDSRDIKARVAEQIEHVEAEAKRMEREAGKDDPKR